MAWTPAPSLALLRQEVYAAYPGKLHYTDGMIGDAAHAAQGWRTTDHMPDPRTPENYVDALDLNHEPANGFDAHAFADELVAKMGRGQEPRVHYVISNGRIYNQDKGFDRDGIWRRFGGDPHTGHVHISLWRDPYVAFQTPRVYFGRHDLSQWMTWLNVSIGDLPVAEDEDAMQLIRPYGYWDTYIIGAGEPKHVPNPEGAQELVDLKLVPSPNEGARYSEVVKVMRDLDTFRALTGFNPADGLPSGER